MKDWQTLLQLDENEQPLDRLVTDGGLCGIFRTIGCVGDSLASGEFEATAPDGSKTYHDMYDYSWGQYLARMAGCTVYNFSRGGMTAKEYMETFALANGYWDPAKACQAYIVALGVNDLYGMKMPVGGIEDICRDDPAQNAPTFAGYYAQVLQRLRDIRPQAPLFLMTMPRGGEDEDCRRAGDAHAALLYRLAEAFGNAYVLDLRRYGPEYDEDFRRRFYLGGHMAPAGYILTARLVASYIDYIIRHAPQPFKQVGFIGTGLQNTDDPNG